MDVNELIEQGMTAMKAGDNDRARDLLQQAVEQDPDNARAWYMLAGAHSDDMAKRRYALEKVLELKPDNEKAKAQLARINQAVATPGTDVPPSAPVEATEAPMEDPTPVDTSDGMPENVEPIPQPMNATGSGGFDLPVDIPGKPETITPQNVIDTFIEILKNGVAILQRKPGVYPAEIQNASWWRFWVFLGGVTLITAIFTTISGAIVQGQLAAAFAEMGIPYSAPNIFNMVIALILTIPIGVAVLYAGVYASHQFVTSNRDGQGSLVNHAYAIMLPVTTASLIGNAISLVFSILPFGGLVGIISLIITIYGWYIAHGGIKMVHKVDSSTATWTLAVLIIVQIVVGIVLGLVLSPLLIGAGALSFL